MSDVPTREEIEKLHGKPMEDSMWDWIVKNDRQQDTINMIESDRRTT